ncbi:hypothetical protein [Alcanivorax hongdengensis]|uniref:hypothetical protein n=1 Tax=Alcanivorax hongdengensis TaxID=519051 RepID=UPI00031FA89C|nr:hypothetical protein [Alcanivorax hongdengensis]
MRYLAIVLGFSAALAHAAPAAPQSNDDQPRALTEQEQQQLELINPAWMFQG